MRKPLPKGHSEGKEQEMGSGTEAELGPHIPPSFCYRGNRLNGVRRPVPPPESLHSSFWRGQLREEEKLRAKVVVLCVPLTAPLLFSTSRSQFALVPTALS